MATTAEFRKGLVFKMDGGIYRILEHQHVKPGKGGAFVRTKLKKIPEGNVIDRTFKSGEKVDDISLIDRRMQYLYSDHDGYHCMDNSTYDQVALSVDFVGEAKGFMVENMEVIIQFHDETPLGLMLPNTVVLEIVECPPSQKGESATGRMKSATVTTGLQVMVPTFINQGDKIRVNTETGQYQERA